MCKENPDLKFLVVVFNKTVSENAKSVFPCQNVNCKTAHSLAYKEIGVHYKAKLCENVKPKDIMCSGIMTEGIEGSGNFIQRAAQIVRTLEYFMNSPDQQVMMEHVPLKWHSRKLHSELDEFVQMTCPYCIMFGSYPEL